MEYIVKPPVSFVYIMMVNTEGFQVLSVDISYLTLYSQTRSSIPVASKLVNSLMEKSFRLLIQ